ncbi:MAG: thioredoxin family protein [Luteibaculum sp.]
MRLVLFSIALSCVFFSKAQLAEPHVNWVSMADLEKVQAKEERKVLVDVYTSWCGPCKMMLKNTFENPEVVEYINKNFHAVKFNAEGDEVINFKGHQWTNEGYDPNRRGRNSTHDLTLAIASSQGRIAYPTIVYMDENLNIIFPVQGYMQPDQIMPLLSYLASDSYKEKSYDDYREAAVKK